MILGRYWHIAMTDVQRVKTLISRPVGSSLAYHCSESANSSKDPQNWTFSYLLIWRPHFWHHANTCQFRGVQQIFHKEIQFRSVQQVHCFSCFDEDTPRKAGWSWKRQWVLCMPRMVREWRKIDMNCGDQNITMILWGKYQHIAKTDVQWVKTPISRPVGSSLAYHCSYCANSSKDPLDMRPSVNS